MGPVQSQHEERNCLALAGERDAGNIDCVFREKYPEYSLIFADDESSAVNAANGLLSRRCDISLVIISDEIPNFLKIAKNMRSAIGECQFIVLCASSRLDWIRRILPFSPAVADAWVVSSSPSPGELSATLCGVIETARRNLKTAKLRQHINSQILALQEPEEVRLRRERILQTERYLSEVLTFLPDAILAVDGDGKLLGWNPAASQLFEREETEELGSSILKFFPDEAQLEIRGILDEVKQGRVVSGHRTVIRKSNGSLLDGEVTMSAIRDSHNNVTAVSVLVRDVSERVSRESQLRHAQKMESIGQLTGGIAHDFNNLLTVILGNSEQLEEQLVSDEQLGMPARMIRMAAQRGAELTSRLLAFARRQVLQPKVLDINKLIMGMDDLLRRTLGEDSEIEIACSGDLWPALVDASQLESAVLNLCINARDAMLDGGRLTIETGNVLLDEHYSDWNDDVAPGSYVMVAVSDTGTGMTPEIAAKVFEPFFTTKEAGKGTGLGLSMVYGFVKQSGGHVKIYSEPRHGTTVKMYFPKAPSNEIQPLPKPDKSEISGGSEKILLVEDDDLVRDHVSALLTRLGYQVISARSGPQAIEAIREVGDLDLLFTDVVMPGGMNGRQLAEEARKLRPNLPILFTSGYTEDAIVHHGRLDRGVHLLQKPYRRKELAAKVRLVLSESGSEQESCD